MRRWRYTSYILSEIVAVLATLVCFREALVDRTTQDQPSTRQTCCMKTNVPCEIERALPSSREETDTKTKHRQEEEAAHTCSDDDSVTEDVIVSQSVLHCLVWFLQPVV